MRILFVRPRQPVSTRGLRHITVCEPLEFEYLAAAVPEHEVRVVDLLLNDDLDVSLRNFHPHLVGSTCYINNVPQALAVCRAVKAFDAKIKTVVGGVHAVLNAEELARPEVNIVVHGEGMETLRDLVAAIEEGKPLSAVPGMLLNTGAGFEDTGKRPFSCIVDRFPLPNREVTRSHWQDYHYLGVRPVAIVKTSWGCPYACTFCYNREMMSRSFCSRSPESVVAELASLTAPYVFFVDDIFFFERKRALRIYALIKERGIRKQYAAYCRSDFIVKHEEVLIKWKEIGLNVLRVGMEAIQDDELDAYNKRISSDCNRRAVEICRNLKITLSASFIIRHDYGKNDFKRLRAYIRNTGLTHVFLNPLTPLPGTELYHRYRNQIIVDHRTMAPLWDFQHTVLEPTYMSMKAFYQQLGMTYITAINPFRRGKLVFSKRPNLVAIWKLLIILREIFMGYKDYERAAKEVEKLSIGASRKQY